MNCGSVVVEGPVLNFSMSTCIFSLVEFLAQSSASQDLQTTHMSPRGTSATDQSSNSLHIQNPLLMTCGCLKLRVSSDQLCLSGTKRSEDSHTFKYIFQKVYCTMEATATKKISALECPADISKDIHMFSKSETGTLPQVRN